MQRVGSFLVNAMVVLGCVAAGLMVGTLVNVGSVVPDYVERDVSALRHEAPPPSSAPAAPAGARDCAWRTEDASGVAGRCAPGEVML